jgi:hypothetical protein
MRPFIVLHVLEPDSYNDRLSCVAVEEILYLQQRAGFTLILLKCGAEWEVRETVGEIAAALHAVGTVPMEAR